MDTTPYILKDFEAFTLETSISDVISLFKETSYSHFPIVKNKKLIGLISETDIQGLENDSLKIDYFQNGFTKFFIEESNNLLEILKVFASNETNIIPVLDRNMNYKGYFDLIDILHIYNDTPFLQNEGVIILLEKETRDYSFSEICQIVESNKGKVLGLFISESNESTLKITLKFSAPEINEIIQSFRRYKYTILSDHEEDFYLEDLKDRSEYLQKYLNI